MDRSTCEVVYTYKHGSKRSCPKPAPYLIGGGGGPQIHTCRAHIAIGLDWMRKQEPDEHHVDVWAP